MRRREFITLIGGAATWPLAARAQQTAKLPTIGVLGSATPSTQAPRFAAFVQRLRELGWIENRTVAIEYRWAEGRSERYSEIAAEFVRLKVDVIVTTGTPVVIVAKQATAVIPIVFVTITDPVGSGLVASLARPGGNVTGLSLQSPDIAGKRLALVREVVPNLRRVAFMGNIDNPFVPREMHEVQAAASTLGLEVAMFEIRRTQDVVPIFEGTQASGGGRLSSQRGACRRQPAPNQHPGAGRAAADDVATTGARRGWRPHVLSYGPSFTDQFRRSGDFVDKILRGAKPADLPVEQPVKFDLVVNLVVAKALGIEIPPTLLARADEVIE
jgi:putative ABC transport system substrate-binding protein